MTRPKAAETRRLREVLFARSVLAGALVAPIAHADPTKIECADANTNGQTLRMTEKFTAARARLQVCQSASCPAMVRADCIQHMDELERVQPTIVFDVRDSSGADVSAARVIMDGTPLSDHLDGAAVRVDPGDHSFTFTAADHPSVTLHFVIKEGEKNRSERVTLHAPLVTLSPATVVPVETSPAPAPHPTMGAQKALGLAAGIEGLVALAAGGAFGVVSMVDASKQKTDCASAVSCDNHAQALSDHDAAATYGTASTIAFVGGGALLAGGALLFFTRTSSPRIGPGAWVLVPLVDATGGGMTLRGRF